MLDRPLAGAERHRPGGLLNTDDYAKCCSARRRCGPVEAPPGTVAARCGSQPDHDVAEPGFFANLETTRYRVNEMPFHFKRALENGVTRDELVELITHLAFYAGWPTAATAVGIARKVFEEAEGKQA